MRDGAKREASAIIISGSQPSTQIKGLPASPRGGEVGLLSGQHAYCGALRVGRARPRHRHGPMAPAHEYSPVRAAHPTCHSFLLVCCGAAHAPSPLDVRRELEGRAQQAVFDAHKRLVHLPGRTSGGQHQISWKRGKQPCEFECALALFPCRASHTLRQLSGMSSSRIQSVSSTCA